MKYDEMIFQLCVFTPLELLDSRFCSKYEHLKIHPSVSYFGAHFTSRNSLDLRQKA